MYYNWFLWFWQNVQIVFRQVTRECSGWSSLQTDNCTLVLLVCIPNNHTIINSVISIPKKDGKHIEGRQQVPLGPKWRLNFPY